MRTYDYILAMKEVNQSIDLLDPLDDSDFSSDESTDFDSPERPKPKFLSRFICRGQGVNQVNRENNPFTLKFCTFGALYDHNYN